MSTFPKSPRIIKGGLVLADARSGDALTMISLQYNPKTLQRSYEPQAFGEGNEPLRLKGPAVETLTIEADIDAADYLEFPDQHRDTVEHGIQPQLAALEAMINPTSAQLNTNNMLQSAGTLEIAPMEGPMALFVWSRNRIVPVRVTSFSITEEAYDPRLNPILAKVELSGTLFMESTWARDSKELTGGDERISLFRLGAGDIALFLHALEHIKLPLTGSFRKTMRRIPAGGLGQAGQNCAFCQV